MVDRAKAFLRHQQQRWLRPDAARWVRPDAAKFLKPGTRPADIYPALSTKFNEDQPRVPAGESGGGQWTSGSGGSGRPRVHIYRSNPEDEIGDGGDASLSLPMGSIDVDDVSNEIDKFDLFDIMPRERQTGGIQLAGDPPQQLPPIIVTPRDDGASGEPGIGHNGGPPLEDPPEIPKVRPSRSKQRTARQRAISSWIGKAMRVGAISQLRMFLAAAQIVSWLAPYWSRIITYLDRPKTLIELQSAVNFPRAGTEVHHRAEKEAMKLSGYSSAEINAPENLVRIPTLKHYEITGWYQTRNEEFGGMTPREYLADKPLVEKLRVGNDALIRFGVMKP